MPGSQKFSQNFYWKILSNFLMVSDVSLEMQSDSKNYVGLQDDEITEPVHTIKSACFASTGGPDERKKRFSSMYSKPGKVLIVKMAL